MRNPQVKEINLNEVVLLTVEQAKSRYNLGTASVRQVADNIGAVRHVGARLLYSRAKLDNYFENMVD